MVFLITIDSVVVEVKDPWLIVLGPCFGLIFVVKDGVLGGGSMLQCAVNKID